MKKLQILLLVALTIILAGCSRKNLEVFRFVNHEINIYVGKQEAIDLVYGEYKKDSEVIYTFSEEGIIELNDNLVTALMVGRVEIAATIDNKKFAKMIVNVIPEPIASMKINSPDTVIVGQTINFTVSVLPSHLSNEVIWSIETSPNSNSAQLVQVGNNATLKGLIGEKNASEFNDGGAKVTVIATSVYDPTMSAKKDIRVKYPATTSVSVAAPTNELVLGETLQLNVTINPAIACPVVTYQSNRPTFATVSSTGLVSTPANSTNVGDVIITVRSLDNKSTTITITIVNPPVTPPDEADE